MKELRYGFGKSIQSDDFDGTKAAVIEALASEGFGVLAEIDVQATLKKKLDVDFRPYVILGACNPPLSHRALQAEAHIGLLLPCNVVVQQTGDNEVVVSALRPTSVFSLVDGDDISPVARDVEEKLRRVIESIS